MPTQPINVIQEELNPQQLSEELAKLQKLLRYLLNGQLDFENITAKGIKTENLDAGAVTAEKIGAKAVTAEKIEVDKLSAISANLGTITAGLLQAVNIIGSIITGSLIQTSGEGNYPRIALSSSSQVFDVQGSASNKIRIYVAGADPVMLFDGGGSTSSIGRNGGNLKMFSPGYVEISGSSGVLANGVNITSGLASNMTFDPTTRNLKLFAPNGTQLAIVNIP